MRTICNDGMQRLRNIAKRLYTEDRLTGDEMRNMAQAIDAVLSSTTYPDEPMCIDCGEEGERAGHMECQYPGRYSE